MLPEIELTFFSRQNTDCCLTFDDFVQQNNEKKKLRYQSVKKPVIIWMKVENAKIVKIFETYWHRFELEIFLKIEHFLARLDS